MGFSTYCHTTVSHSRSHVTSSLNLFEPAEPVDSTVPTEPIGDLISIYPSNISTSRSDVLTSTTDIPSSFTSALPPLLILSLHRLLLPLTHL